MWTFYIAFLLFITQVQQSWASGCSFVSVTSPSPSTLNVVWNSYAGASIYMLDLRVLNSTNVAPVVVMQAATSTQRLVMGLRPGHLYEITLKVFEFYNEVCSCTTTAMTVPAASQITLAEAISSTSIRFNWLTVAGAESYILEMEKLFTTPPWSYSQTFTAVEAQVDNLTPSTTYSCAVYSSNSAGRGPTSNTRTILTLVEPPSSVNAVMTGRSTAHVSWSEVNNVLSYQVVVSDADDPSIAPVIHSTSHAFMDISDLEPCSTYTVGVSSFNMFLVPGEPSNDTVTTSTINPVTTVSVDYSCTNGRVTVTWDLVFGANSYRAVAVASSGAERNCTSGSSSCQISMLDCGEEYSVHVVAISDDCESTTNISTTFETVPCAPKNPQATHECSSNVILFTWEPTNNTFYYVATATDNAGTVTECRTAGNTCYFTSTDCGQFYSYNVYAVSSGCNSEVSQPEFIRTSPCLPTNIRTSEDCDPDKLVTNWDSAEGAQYYTVELRGNIGDFYNCTTSYNNCTIGGVPCGEHLSVWITASNDNCSTIKILGQIAHSIPCTPTNVSAIADCNQDSVVMNWTSSLGSVIYTAIAQDSNGNIYTCNSMDTDCLMDDLRCGEYYTSKVVGNNFFCNSTESHEVSFSTASCSPSSIQAIRDCDHNNALIVWQDHQTTGNYTALIEDQTGATLNCTSNTVNSCLINSLPCGRRYNVSVEYDDGKCQSKSQTTSMDSVPCGPEHVQSSIACNSGDLTLSWNISAPADNYTATIMSGVAGPVHCNSTSTYCTIGGLDCGSLYTVKVTSITGTCQSLPSAEVHVQTYPCPPTNVAAEYKCAPQSIPVSWAASNHSKYYVAEAVSSSGHRSECTTNQTSCSFSGLHCGEVYNITVVGANDNCTGQQSDAISLYTEPCVPTNVSSQAHCESRTADVSWAPSSNAQSYSVRATSEGHTLTCNSSRPNCTLSGLHCGQVYHIVVSATDGRCLSNYSSCFRQEPIPCSHVSMNTSLCCQSNNLTVSWNSSDSGSSNYIATALSAAGARFSCHSYGSSCVLSGLECGKTYNVSLTASSGGCGFPNSTYEIVQTAPCPPQGLQAQTNCASDALYASWNTSLGATSYTATLTRPNGVSDTCDSSNLTCSFSGLQCATRYNVSVTSRDARCTSSPTQVVMTTRPCDSTNVTTVLQCGSNIATVSWDAAAPGVTHTVVAQEHGSQQQTSCRSNSTSCQLDQLQCGKMYNLTIHGEDTVCNSTVGTTAVLMTAPCSPSIQSSTLLCGTNSSTVSWQPVTDATGYTVNATGTSGHTVSCNSPAATCVLTDLLCAENYTVTVIAHGDQCDSAPGLSSIITTTPCTPMFTFKQYDCENNTVELSWTNNDGGISFVTELSGQGYLNHFNTTNTNCLIHNLPCGLDLNVTVQALGTQCHSPPSSAETIKTVPCGPRNINTTLICSNHSVLLTWEGNPSDVGYQAVATGQDGHTHHCHTNSTSCQISAIHCGETYNVTITPYSDSCTGSPSAVYSHKAGQCPPQNVSVNQSCNEVTVSWSNVPGADSYVATATADDGHSYNCSANQANSCNFTELRYGETYHVRVVTVDRGCWSEPSPCVEVTTALCATSNLTGEFDCDTDAVTLQWESQGSGVSYTIKTEIIGGILPPYENTTTNTFCTMTNLLCGQRYSFKLGTENGQGSTHYSSPIEITTAPCQPTNLTARVDCGTNRGNFSWMESMGASFYTVQVTGEHGHVASCSSNDSSCCVKLHCGRSYSATLLASTESCNSTRHADIQFESAPCLPDDVDAVLDCETNVMNVSWPQTAGTDNYTAWAIGCDGSRTSCNTSSNFCLIHDLQCGHIYEVAVTSSSIHCDIIAGSDYKVQTAPCKPGNTTVEQNCSSNTLTVKWNQMSRSQNYTVTATSASGVNSTCCTTDNSCPFLDLMCDELYTFTVMAHSNVCMSEMSTVQKRTGPCPPSNVSTSMNCTSREALVSWNSAAAASSYRVQATSRDGHNTSCSATGTSGLLDNLMCGQEYTVVVEAINSGCPGPASTPAKLITGPCPPMNLSVHYNVSHSYATWSAASGADYYCVHTTTDHGLNMTCNTTDTRCSLTGLSCGQSHNISVTSHNVVCDSMPSHTQQVMTEPCSRLGVQVSLVCDEEISANVSWQQSHLAVGYVAYFDDQNGNTSSCEAADTERSCVASGLTCGTDYNVWVQALGPQDDSSNSTVASVTTGPCQPTAIEIVMDCETNSATVSWQPAVGASSYVSEIVSSSGHTSYCHSDQNTNCQLTSLQCGEDYNVTVKSVGETCNSTGQMAHFSSEPCPPTNLSVNYNMSIARVQWSATNSVRACTVEAVTEQGLTTTCNSSSATSCLLTGLQCGQTYNITVKTHSGACNNTSTSDSHQLTTEPCPPANVVVAMACESQTASVSWDLSDHAVGYVAYFDGQNGECTTCMASDSETSCEVSGLKCGEEYDVRVKAVGRHYNSSDSAVVTLATAPCQPTNLTARVDCGTNRGNFSWMESMGASFYTVQVTGEHGHVASCSSNDSSCCVKLHCGRSYSATLLASTESCNSTRHADIQFESAPCLPDDVDAVLDCETNVMNVSWTQTAGTDNYTAWAIGCDGNRTSCNTSSNFCLIHDLQCGHIYEVAVTSSSIHCDIIAGSDYKVQTAPCKPENTTVEQNCSSNTLTVKWNQMSRSQNYTVTATSASGVNSTCCTTDNSCPFLDLMCDELYTFTVMAHSNVCMSEMSTVQKRTGPCPPSNVSTSMNCTSREALVSWNSAAAASSYRVQATSRDGHNTSCSATGTSGLLHNLMCGQEYTVVVEANNSGCPGPASTPAKLITGPCPPMNLSVHYNMSHSYATWSAASGADYYCVHTTTDHGLNMTCNTTDTRCSLTGLSCGQSHNISVTSHNVVCDSMPSHTQQVMTEPCPPLGVQVSLVCDEEISANVSWQQSHLAVGYVAYFDDQNGNTSSCEAADTECSCVASGLTCGTDYNVWVQSLGQRYDSSNSTVASVTTGPCQPTAIEIVMDCETNSATVSWQPAVGASSYVSEIVSSSGHTSYCHSDQNTNCQLTSLQCGEDYNVTVKSVGETCNSTGQMAHFSSEPCPPTNLSVNYNMSIARVQWSATNSVRACTVEAVTEQGLTTTCNSSSATSCLLTGLQCGQTYNITVKTHSGACNNTSTSDSHQLTTEPCPPANVVVAMACESQTASVSWDLSDHAVGYVAYFDGQNGECTTCMADDSETSCEVGGLKCGEEYDVRVKAVGRHYNSSDSAVVTLATAPCQPTNLTARVDCGTNRGNFSWMESMGASFYTVQVTGEHGHVASCSSNDSSCCVKLHCGRSYSATLLASTESCNSTRHADIQFESAPCLPDDVDAVLDCETNVMNVSWTQTAGTDNYTAWAIGCDGNRTSCNTSSNFCLIHDLQCGHIYEVAVTSSSIHCDIIAGSDYKVQTAPCKPENTTVEQNCSSNTLTVKWNQMSRSQNYTVTATSASGVNSTCCTTDNSCPFLDLMCDELYTFTVMAHSNVCMSEMSTVQKRTGPCPPSNVFTSMNCTSREALVSWNSAAAASSYRVQATSRDGHNTSCSATGTSGLLDNLMCGQEYTVVVEAINSGCPGPASTPAKLITGPCPPMNLSVHYNMSHSYATWSAASGADYYCVHTTTDHGLNMTCNTTDTRCSLTGLSCGQSHNISVTSHNVVCDSMPSHTQQVMTEPCPPLGVQVSLVCDEEISANVSWQQSHLAVGYVAYFDDQNGNASSCEAADTECSCVASGLTCGTDYNVWVQALGQRYDSSDSTVASVTTGPCQPTAIEIVMDCEINSATVSWQPAVGASSYVSEIVSSSGHTSYCHSDQNTNCQLTSLQCGEDYNVTVKSVGETCNSTGQVAHFTSEPCPPTNLSVNYNMSIARVQWSATNGARAYAVEAVTEQGLTTTCNSSSATSCLLTGLQCGQTYNITVKTHSGACNNTSTSDSHQLTTEPCPPANVVVAMACESQTASVSWELSDHAVGYVAYFDGQNGECTTCMADDSETSCEVSGLKCGEEYDVRVKAVGRQDNSSDSAVVTLATAPCLPTHVDVDVDCHSDSDAVVSWNPTDGAANFSLTTSTSAQVLCVTQQTSCNLTGLNCGENHNLTLTVSNQQCSLTVPLQTNLTTRPCPPQSVAVDFLCGASTALVSWDPKSEVQLYTATAYKTPGGEVQICDSMGSNCQFTDLSCGETYNVTVKAESHGCFSRESSTVTLQTEPCPPANVSAQALCQSEDIQISWQPASGVVNYLIRARGNLGYVEFYNTTQDSVTAVLPCGQSYNVTVEGEGSVCNSIESSPAVVKAGPCAPRDVMTYVQCENNTGSVSWGSSDGAHAYNVEATGLDGHVHGCVTNSTSCTWNDLHCGDQYTVVVRAKDENCTSPPSNSSIIHMAPCSSQNLFASVDCDTRVVALNWTSSVASAYLVTAANWNTSFGLTTNGTTAYFSEFKCGQNYNLTVTSQSQRCAGTSSSSVSVLTWPCPPQRVSTVQNCMSDSITVTWQASNGSDNYAAKLKTDTGVTEMCISDSDRCDVQGLTCGHNFSVSVIASNQQCNVTSDVAHHQSAPCTPTNVSVVMDCSNNTALVSWSPSRGAAQYSVTAYSQDVNVSCQATTDHCCRLDNLACGHVYSVQAVAMDDDCSSLPSQAVTLTSAPCSPHNVTTELDCSSNSLTVSWETIRDAEYFLVTVTEDDGGVIESRNTSQTECYINNLACGSTYSVNITSHRGDCHSCSQTNSIVSAPCTPQNINGSLDCVTNSAWISWDAADGADSYTVSAVGGDQGVVNCTTSSSTTCEVENLACGVCYNFTVVATNSMCESPASTSTSLETAPCSLSSITAIPQCHNSSILVVWELMDGGDGDAVYIATAESSDHTYLTCNDTGTSCSLYGAECGKHYTVIVAADSDQCSSMRSPPYRISMEPCPPSGVQVNTSCEDQSAVVSWSPSPMAETYHVEVRGVDGHTHTCNSTCSNCTVTGLHCDRHYTVSLTASHENCSSSASQSISFYTGPCQPEDLAVTFNCVNQSAVMSWSARDNSVQYYGCALTDDGEALYCQSSTANCTFEGLDCGTMYNFSVQASDGTCNSSFSDPVKSGAAPCPPADVEVELLPMQTDVQVLRFSWSQVDCRDTQYLVEATGTLLGDSHARFEISSYWTNASFFEIPLPCGSDYTATMRSMSGSATSDPSAALTGTTAPCAPVDVEYSGNSTFATVSWNASVFATSYAVYDGNISSSAQLCVTGGLSCSLSNITTTNVMVTASNDAGESEGTTVTFVGIQARRRRDLTAQMSKYGFTAPLLEVTQAATAVFVEWSHEEAASHHILVIRKQGSSSDTQEMEVYGGRMILTQLSPGSTYCFAVSARFGDQSGPQSEPVCVQTGLEFSQ